MLAALQQARKCFMERTIVLRLHELDELLADRCFLASNSDRYRPLAAHGGKGGDDGHSDCEETA